MAVEAIRTAVKEVDPEMRLEHVRTMESVLDRELMPWRFHATLVTAFACVALVLASLGVFGMVAHGVSQRTREIGLRLAIGARNEDVTRLVVREGMRPVLLGLVAGLSFALLCARLLSAHLYQIAPTDPMTYGGVGLLIAIVACLACYLPARRVARLDPAVVLRYE